VCNLPAIVAITRHKYDWLGPTDFHIFGPLMKNLAGKQFAADAKRSKLPPPDYGHLTVITSVP